MYGLTQIAGANLQKESEIIKEIGEKLLVFVAFGEFNRRYKAICGFIIVQNCCTSGTRLLYCQYRAFVLAVQSTCTPQCKPSRGRNYMP